VLKNSVLGMTGISSGYDRIEWIVWSPEQNDLMLIRAFDQRDAIVQALDYGYAPGRSSHARPRTGDSELMSREEFEEFMDY